MSSNWETFRDDSYYHMWRLRRKNERKWDDGFHINSKEEAEALCELLNKLEGEIENLKASGIHTCHDQCQRPMCVMRRERDEARQQRDRLAEALRSIANGSHCMQCYGGDGVWIAQQALAAVKGGSDE